MTVLDHTPTHFDGRTYDPAEDRDRLSKQYERVFAVMKDGNWHTLAEIAEITGDSERSIHSRIDDMRKPRNGAYDVQSRRLTNGTAAWEYRLGEKGAAKRRPNKGQWADKLAAALAAVDPNNDTLNEFREASASVAP